MASSSPASGPNLPESLSDRFDRVSKRLSQAMRDLNRQQAEQPMRELKELIKESKQTEPALAAVAATILEFLDSVFLLLGSNSKEELQTILDRLEKCRGGELSTSAEWQAGVNQQILQARSKLLRLEQQEISAELKSIEDQQRDGMRQIAQSSDSASLDRVTMKGFLTYFDALQLLTQAASAQSRMELDAAAAYFQEASAKFTSVLESFNAVGQESEVTKLMKGMTTGLEGWTQAQTIYASVLQKALSGGATADSLVELERAEQLFLSTGLRLQDVAPGFARLTGQEPADFRAVGEQLSRVARNLRQLCMAALRPKSVAAQTAPRFFAFFVITFVVLLGGMRFSGLVSALNGANLGELLLLCLAVSACSSFGLDGIRVIRAFMAQKKPSAQSA